MIANATAYFRPVPPWIPTSPSAPIARSSTTHVLTPIQPIVSSSCTAAGT